MQVVLMVLISLALLYVLSVTVTIVVSAFIIRQKLRKYQESGRFGY